MNLVGCKNMKPFETKINKKRNTRSVEREREGERGGGRRGGGGGWRQQHDFLNVKSKHKIFTCK